ncbi:hypothetical protein L0P88_16010 [Muricauda sp. SCSIO 64092]|uniref:hypothetical protein n=1 Tax=Allomuricauda sp. SCSIO 64092 TaxID=2908842 RepID=UPI001FF3F044|nr:hypothetical protein [Muricauda sp. SCSIO 64092]UOY05448.1 hypothetical protein L0P88_16010 [Muricauda sp. SCSIO 64092]
MKNLSLARTSTGILSVCLMALVSCNPQQKKETVPEMADEPMEEVKAPKEIISLEEAKVLCENYQNRRIPDIVEFEMGDRDSEEKFMPTQFVAFKLETLKRYIKYVERKARKAEVDADSLRIYFGNYGKEGRDPNRNTVFILPTAKIANDYGGFYIGGDGQAKLIRNYWPKAENGGQEGEPKSKASFIPTFDTGLMQGDGSLILNHGGSGPPPGSDF